MAMIQNRTPIRERTRGQWRSILITLGIDPKYLTGKNGPCPFCGGKDRWRFTNYNGDGCWICNRCGTGSGTDLLMKYTGQPFREIAPRIEAVIGFESPPQAKPKRDLTKLRGSLNALWSNASPVRRGDATDLWLRSRGLGLDLYPPCLRTGRNVRFNPDNDSPVTLHPAMLALVTGPGGKPATVHRTYLSSDGRKAPVEKPRKLYSQAPKGSAVRLAVPAAATLGIAEGIETALSAGKLFGIPTWSVICAHGIETFEPPAGIARLLIFADHDRNHVGQKAAHTLAARLAGRLTVEVKIPEEPDTDWNDALRGRL